jgi:hypothetical protein
VVGQLTQLVGMVGERGEDARGEDVRTNRGKQVLGGLEILFLGPQVVEEI